MGKSVGELKNWYYQKQSLSVLNTREIKILTQVISLLDKLIYKLIKKEKRISRRNLSNILLIEID